MAGAAVMGVVVVEGLRGEGGGGRTGGSKAVREGVLQVCVQVRSHFA